MAVGFVEIWNEIGCRQCCAPNAHLIAWRGVRRNHLDAIWKGTGKRSSVCESGLNARLSQEWNFIKHWTKVCVPDCQQADRVTSVSGSWQSRKYWSHVCDLEKLKHLPKWRVRIRINYGSVQKPERAVPEISPTFVSNVQEAASCVKCAPCFLLCDPKKKLLWAQKNCDTTWKVKHFRNLVFKEDK